MLESLFFKKHTILVVFGFLAAIPDDVLAGWVASLDKVYTIVGGYFTSVSFALLLFAHGSHVFVLFLDFSVKA
jgi:hypothetical protein